MSTSSNVAGGDPEARRRATILVVEEQFVSEFLRSALTHQGYIVKCASLGAARGTLRRERASIRILITNAPAELIEFADVPVLYLAACPDPAQVAGFARSRTLAKPFHPRELFECVAALLP